MSIRIGNVAYLNAAPLVAGVAAEPTIELVADTPARVAEELRAGRLDLGLAPVVEAARDRLYAVPGVGVCARGAVRSVLLVSRVPVEAIEVLALDPASRTSAALVQLLLRRDAGCTPRLIAGGATGSPLPDAADAGLVIGDRALVIDRRDVIVTDLGEWWARHTGLPFVFAIWVGRDPQVVSRLVPAMQLARDRGVEALAAIAEQWAPVVGLPLAATRSYLEDALHWRVGPRERAGLARFIELLRAEGLIEPEAAIRFVDEES